MTSLGTVRPVDDSTNDDPRSDGLRDADRILYSSHFRRLSGVTQVVSPQDGHVLHDRLMHTLKVAQVAQRLAQRLQRNRARRIDPDYVYAAALAHDLGHPPFGHAAEKELNLVLGGKKLRDGNAAPGIPNPILRDGFEGNAQTFRIAVRLAARVRRERAGLNLSWRTYGALLKYPWERDGQPDLLSHLSNKWSVYDPEQAAFEHCVEMLSGASTGNVWGPTRSL